MRHTALLLLLAAAASAETVALQNATVMTVTNGTFRGSVLLRDGKIAAVGPTVAIPPGTRLIDASGRYVIPGIIDCHSHIAADAINEGSVSVSSMARIQDVLNPTDIAIYRALAGGVTTANILHGSANAIGGLNAVVKLRWGRTGPEMLFEGAKPGIKFALGENPKRQGNVSAPSASPRYPATRMGVEDVIREAFTEAKRYQKEWRDWEAGGRTGVAPRRDLKLDPLVEVLEDRRFVHAHCYRADEILMLLRVADEFGFKVRTLQHVLEGYKVAREIAAHGAGASTFSDWWSYKVEAFDAIPHNAALMHRKGVLVSLNSDSAELMRHLNAEAAKTQRYGELTDDEALAMVTINPARQLAIDNRVGSIEVGKDADLVVYDAHPLSNYAKVEMTIIDGQVYFDRAKDLEGRARLSLEKKALQERLAEAARRDRLRPAAAKPEPAKDPPMPRTTPELPPDTPQPKPPSSANPVPQTPASRRPQ